MSKVQMYFDGNNYVAATSPSEARQLLIHNQGAPYHYQPFELCDQEKPFTCHWMTPLLTGKPFGDTPTNTDNHKTQKISEWVKELGPGYCFSLDW